MSNHQCADFYHDIQVVSHASVMRCNECEKPAKCEYCERAAATTVWDTDEDCERLVCTIHLAQELDRG